MALSVMQEHDILRYYFAEKWRVGTIARQLNLHHSTVERVIAQAGVPKPERSQRCSIIDPYLPFIVETLQQYPSLTAARLYQMPEAFMRLNTLPGEQAQVDWGHFGYLEIGRAKRQLMAFVMVLSYSRRLFVRFFLNSRTGPFLQGHVQAFEQWQGVPRIILYDNLKSAVLARQGQAIEFNPALLELAAHYRFEPRPVAVARGNEKGRVERAIRYLRDNFFAGRPWRDIDDLNAQALQWSLGPAMERPCPQETSTTVGAAFDKEQPSLMALPDHPFSAAETLAVSVGKTPFVRFDLNDYSVPPEWVHRQLTIVADEHRVRMLDQGRVIADHVRHYGRREQIIDPAHLDALRQHKRQAKGHSGQHRLLAVCTETETLLQQSLERGHRLGATIRLLLEALDDYGAVAFCGAVRQALASDSPHANAVTQILQRQREKHHRPPPLTITSSHPKARVPLKTPSLDPYKQLMPSHDTEEVDHE